MSLGDRLRRIPVAARLAAMMAGVLVVGIGTFGAVGLVHSRRQALKAVRSDARRLVRSLERALRGQMLRKGADLGDSVARIARPGGVESLTLTSHKGSIRYATRKKVIDTTVKIGDARCTGCHPGGGRGHHGTELKSAVQILERPMVARATMPILNARECSTASCHAHSATETVLGVLEIDVSYRSTARMLRTQRLVLVALLVAIVGITTPLVFLLVRRWVGRPVAQLLRGTRHVARGEMDLVMPVGGGELGELTAAFNVMQERLRTGQRQIVISEKLASVGKLAAAVAHEINNPLTGILTFAEELSEDSAEDDPRRRDYEVIRHETLRCRQIVRRLLDFARQEQPSMRRLRAADVLDDTLALVGRLAVFHDIRIVREEAEDLPGLLGDPSQLQQVFLNLLVNAAQAMPQGGTLTIRGALDGEAMIHLDFVDTGQGIREEHVERIFEPFFSTKQGESSGLGLAVCLGIIEQHGGAIVVSSTVGVGSTFRVSLPAARPDEKPVSIADPQPGRDR